MEPIVTANPNVMHGTPRFAGTRVAVKTFFDHLEAGYTIDGFLEQFPSVRRDQVVGLLEILRKDAASAGFDAVITNDRGIEYEQNLDALPTATAGEKDPSISASWQLTTLHLSGSAASE